MNSAPAQQLVVYRTESNTPAEEALNPLGTLAADLGTGPSVLLGRLPGRPKGLDMTTRTRGSASAVKRTMLGDVPEPVLIGDLVDRAAGVRRPVTGRPSRT
ncbi:hypothetical protein AB0D56_19735 [Streptomyces sp. NPDC048209]|uniref:hypothetical protein n=1 Tax=Streptomyces sp. NPDC048209 TaxID=3156689 RepID=UPI00341A0313